MPYSTTRALPKAVREALPATAQRQFLHVVNTQLARGLSDSRAFASAWSVIHEHYRKDPMTGRWVAKQYGQAPTFDEVQAALQPCGTLADVSQWSRRLWEKCFAPRKRIAKQPTLGQVHVPSTQWGASQRRQKLPPGVRLIHKGHDGLWIGFVLNPQERQQLQSFGDADCLRDAHVTLLYFPDDGHATDERDEAVLQVLEGVARVYAPFTGNISGIGYFEVSEASEEQQPLVGLVDSPALSHVWSEAIWSLKQQGLVPSELHGYQPHVTLAYLPAGEDIAVHGPRAPIPLAFSALTLRHGGKEVSLPLTGMQKCVGYGRIAKIDEEHHYVFGWASVALTQDGLLIDRQQDMITPDDMEAMAYDFVLHARETGEMHEGGAKGPLIESMIYTADKLRVLGLPLDYMVMIDGERVPLLGCWWIGFFVPDETAFQRVKRGDYKGFSIQGEAVREEVTA